MRTINVWLCGYAMIEAAQFLRTVVIIMIWMRARDPSHTQLKLELFYGLWVFIVEAGWLIYGNTFVYSDTIKECDYENEKYDVQTERVTCLVIIIYGYLLLAGIVFLILFYVSAYFGYKAYVKGDLAQVAAQENASETTNGLTR